MIPPIPGSPKDNKIISGPMLPRPTPQQQEKSIFEVSTEVACACGGKLFRQGVFLRNLSRLVTGKEDDSLVTIPVFFCQKCGKILEDYLPEELKTPKLV